PFDHIPVQIHRKLWCRNHSLHDRDLLALLSAEVALIESDEESAKAGAENEGAAREDQGDEAERSAFERASDGPAPAHEGTQSARLLVASIDSDAVPVCTLSRGHDLT